MTSESEQKKPQPEPSAASTREIPTIDFSFVLASGVHDMKNSLGMLLNTLANVMEKYPPQDPEQARAYAVLEYETARINSELIQLLSLYRLDHDHIRVHLDEHFVVDLLREQIARNHGLLQSRHIQLELLCDEELQAYFDYDLIGGLINNLLVNCARYCRQRLRLSASQTSDGLCILIEDDGPGYPPHMLETPEEPGFVQGRPHLGLLFANKIALLHRNKDRQGYIQLSNGGSLGGGCFALYLP
jgi:signal transduction histidine kinase